MQAYQILWIDDEHDEQDMFLDFAEQHELYITAYKTSREGMEYLEANLDTVDAVILDAKVFKDSTDEVAKLKGLQNSIRTIAGLQQRHNLHIPHVVFTGQADLESSESFHDQMDEIPVFSKHTQRTQLITYLRGQIADSRNAYYRNEYADIYSFCQQDSLTPPLWTSLLSLLKHSNEDAIISIPPYNEIRSCLEYVFRILHKKKVLHEHLVGKDVNLTLASLYLSGMTTDEKREIPPLVSKETIFPGIISTQVKFILDITQGGSHSDDPDMCNKRDLSIALLEQTVPKHHLIKTLIPMLLDVTTWAISYLTENPDPEENKKLWFNLKEDSHTCQGEVIKVGPHLNIKVDKPSFISRPLRFDPYIHTGLSEGDRVILTTEYDSDTRNPTHLKIAFLNKVPNT